MLVVNRVGRKCAGGAPQEGFYGHRRTTNKWRGACCPNAGFRARVTGICSAEAAVVADGENLIAVYRAGKGPDSVHTSQFSFRANGTCRKQPLASASRKGPGRRR